MADGDFSALIQAKLQTDELEAKLKEIQNRKIELNFEVSNGKDAAQKLADSINKGLKSTKLQSVDLTKQITEAFNISDKGVTKQIKAQVEQMMASIASTWNGQTFKLGNLGDQFDAQFDQLANTIAENANVIQSSMGIYDEFFNYFKGKKIFISDDLKNAFNVDEYKELLRNNIGSIVRDATKGISIDSIWGEMTDLFPEYFSENVTNQVDQIVQAFNLLKQARADVTKSISAKDLSAEDYLGITNDAYSKVGEIASQIGESLQASIQAASASAQNTVEINVQVNTDKIISDIQTAIKNATSSLGNAIEVKLNINEAELATAVQNALANVTAGGAPVSIAVTVDQQTLQDDLNTALSNLNLPIHFTVDAAQLESEIRAALNNITDISVDLHVNTDSLTDASNGVYNYLDMFEVDTVGADALLSDINDINAAGQRGDSIFQSFSGTLREVFGMYTAARLLRDAVYKVISAGKEAVQTVVDIDSSMTQLQIVTGATSSEMTEFLETSISLAKELGQSVTDIVDSMTTFSRLGYSLEESSQLASYAAILSNTAAVSTDDATTGLTAILAGYNLSVDQAENVASTLISVGNNYAISASELIEAYEKAGAALSASGTSFEESAGLFAAANAANQSASSVGTALKTVSARIRSSTTAGQQELEELGEDVTELSNGFSTYASELESLTGFSILEEGTTDTYKNIYEIFEGISEVWDKLSDTAQARVSTILGGTRQYSIIASLLGSWDDAAGAYADAMESAGTAAAANEQYMESIQAKLDQLSASLQSLAYDVIPTDLYGQLIDCGTAIVEFADNTQILQAALAGIGTAGAVAVFEKMASSVREVVTGFSNFSTALNMVQTGNITGQFDQLLQLTNGLSTSQTKLILSSTSLTDAQRVAVLMNQGMSEAEAQATLSTMGLATAQGGATTTTVTFSSALKGLWSTLLANPLVLVAAGVTAAVAGFSAYNRSVKEARESATDAAEAWGESNDSLSDYRDRILELREALDSGTLSEEDAYEAKSELLSIQQSLSESYGEQVEGLSLVNGELQTQLDLIDQLSTADAKTYLKDNADQIKKATNKIEGFEFSLGTYYSDTEIGDALESIISQYSDYFRKESTWDGGIELYFDANAEDAETVLSDFKLQILDLQESTGDDSFLNAFYKGANNAITQASSVLEKWQEIYDEAQEAQIIADTQTFSYGGTEQTAAKWLSDYAKAVEAYNEALALGDTEEIETAKAAYDSLAEAMDYLVQNTDMSDYADNVSEIGGELDTASVAANNLKDALQGINIDDDLESVVKTYADRLTDAGLTDIDFQLVLENPEEYDMALADAVTGLQWYATQAGVSVDDLITMLTDLGIVSTQVSEDVDEAAESAVQLTENQLANLKNTFHETREENVISQWFDGLSDSDKSIVYQVALNYDISDLQTVQDWIDALANETSLQSFYDLLEDEEDDNFSDALAEYTDDLQTLQEAYENLLSGDLSDSDIVELEAEFGELVGHTDDTEELADAIQKLMNKIIGLSDDTADSDTVMGLFNDTLEELGGESTAAGQALLQYRDDLLALFEVAEENTFDSVVESSQNAIDSISAVVDALNEQTTGTSVDYESFTSDELADYQSALEYVNGSLQLNKTKVQEITEAKVAEAKATNEATKAQKQADYAANAKEIEKLTDSLSECDETSDEYADTLAQIQKLQSDNSAISAECTQLDLLNATLDESISKYQKWKDALNASESGDMFDDMQDMMQAIKDVNDTESESYGKVGTATYQAAVDFIVPDTIDKTDQDAVYSYLQDIEKYMTFDDDGGYTGLNLSQFITDAVDQGLMYLDEDSQSYKIAGEQTMQAFADGMGLSLETVQAIFGELEEYLPEGSEFVWSDGSKSLEDMAMAANEAATALQQIDSTKELDIVTDVSGIEDTETKISTLESTIQQMEELKAQPDIDTTQIDNANAVIEYCQALIDDINGTDTSVDVDADTTDADTGIADVNNTEIEDKTTTITADDQASPVIQSIKTLLSTLRDKVVTITTNRVTTTSGTESATGTAYVSGTAKASGDWGTKKSGRTLVGELGREIVVNPYTGKWYTVGDNGAEFVDIPKGSIVFDHLQSESLLNDGYVASRGLALAGGTALAGSSSVSGGGIKVTTVTNQSGSKSTTTTTATSTGSSSSSSSSSSSTDTETALEKFQDWFSQLFDWIEVKLERQTQKISRYIQKAENYLNDENYTKSANYYAKAINTTANQIGTEESASTKYTSKANSVLKKAQKQGLITSKQASSIKSSVANGTMNIASYSDEVQEVISSYMEWTDKATEASDAVDELHANIQTYIQDLKDLRDAQRDATIESTETYESIATSGYAYTATEKNSQLGSTNNQLRAQNTAYSTATAAVASDTATIASNGTSAITSALSSSSAKKNSSYKKALQNAQKAINSNTAVSDSDLNTIKSYSSTVYEKLYAYNEALENLETARLEEATNYAATRSEIYDNIAETYENMDSESEDKIDLYEQKASNASSASEANKYLSAAASQYDTILSNDRAEISRYSSDITGYKSTISGTAATSALSKLDTSIQEEVSTYTEKARSAAKSGVAIEAYVLEKLAEYYSKGYITAAFYNACVDYNNALAYKEQAEAQLEIDEQTAKAEKASLGQSMVENIQSEYENKRSANASATSLLQAQQATITASGGVLSEENYQDLIEQSQEEQQILSDERDALLAQIQENLASGLWDENTQEYLDAVGTVTDLETEIEGCVQDQIEYNAAIINLPIEKLETLLELTDAITASMQSLISLNTAKGLELTLYDEYIELLGEQAEQVTYYYNLMQEALQNYYAAVENGGTYGDKSTADWLEDFYNYRSSMYSAKEAYVDTTNAIIQLPFDSYDEIIDLYQAAISYEESLQSLREAQGQTYTEADYSTRLRYINTEIAQLEKERDLAYRNYETAKASEDGAYGGKTANEWLTEYFGYLTDINGLLEEIEDINNDIVDSVYEQLEGYADLLAAITEYDKALNDIKETRGISLDLSDYQTVITDMQNQITQYTKEMEQLYADWQTAIANGGSYADKTADEWGVEYYNMGTTINNLVSDIEELYNEIAQMPYDEIQATLDLIEAISDYNESAVSLKEALGTDLDASDYWTQISDLQDQITQYEAEQAQAIADYKKAQESDDGVYGGKTADEWLAEYYEYSTEINNLTADIEELKDSLRDDVFWRTFERAHDACSRLSDVLSGIKDLIDEDMYFDADGNMTDFGVAQLANLVKSYETASEEVQNYSNDIANLNQLYEDGWYTEEEYNEMLAQLQSSMLDAASNMKDAMQEVIDILKQEAELELESLQDIITARKDALQSKSDYYSYNKTISEKNADVESLKSQIAALDGVTDAASRAKKAQLEAQLAESESDLQDEIYEHSIELSQTALDELSDSLSDAFDEYWDSVTSDLDEMMNLLQAANDIYAQSAVEVVDTLNQLLAYYGISNASTGTLQAAGYASGTKSLKGDQLTLTQEDGTEAIVLPDGSILTPLPDGTSIFNAAQTGNLWDWSKLNPYDYTTAYTPDTTAIEEAKVPGEINVHYDSLLTVNGDVSKDTLPELKTILEKSYEYTVREIKRDARKVGIKT